MAPPSCREGRPLLPVLSALFILFVSLWPRSAAAAPKFTVAPVSLSGVGVAPGFRCGPTQLHFDTQRTGGCSPAQLVRVTNSGTDALQVDRIQFEGPQASSFRTLSPPFSVPPAGSGFIEVRL